jgi:plastocyanin
MPIRSAAMLSTALLIAVTVPGRAQEARAIPAPQAVVVHIDNFTFSPGEITIAPGTTVTWVNHDDIPHVVVDTGKAFRSRVLDTDERFSFTFASPGAFTYFCSLHPHMTGHVTVRAVEPGGASAAMEHAAP